MPGNCRVEFNAQKGVRLEMPGNRRFVAGLAAGLPTGVITGLTQEFVHKKERLDTVCSIMIDYAKRLDEW